MRTFSSKAFERWVEKSATRRSHAIAQLAGMSGLSYGLISTLSNGKYNHTLNESSMRLLSLAMSIPVDELFPIVKAKK